MIYIVVTAIKQLRIKDQKDENFKTVDERMNTFRNWPSQFIQPEDLANNGFVYSGVDDLTTCVYCGLEIDEWEQGDSPATLHQTNSPCCPVVIIVDGMNAKEGKYEPNGISHIFNKILTYDKNLFY